MVCEGDPFIVGREKYSMIASDRAASERGEADCASGTRSCHAIAATFGVSGKINSATSRCRFAQHYCRSGRRVDLHAVVHFKDLDVPILAQL